MSKKPKTRTSPSNDALIEIDDVAIRDSLHAFLEAVLASCLDVLRSEKLSDEEFMRLAGSALRSELRSSDVEHLSERARRALSARIFWASIVFKRKAVLTDDPERAAFVDGMLFDTVMAASYLAQLGENNVELMESVLGFRTYKEGLSSGGTESAKVRTTWRVEARKRYDRYVLAHPHITASTDIAKGIRKMGPVPGWPSDKQVTFVVAQWQADKKAETGNAIESV